MSLSRRNECSDLELVELVVLREADAFDEIYRRHAVSVAATARMVLGNSSTCEDVVAEVFLAFWLKPESFDLTRGTLLGFLRLKARGRSIDIVRSEVARRRRELTDSVDARQCPIQLDENMLYVELTQKVQKALDGLIEREREPIQLAFYTGMTYKDVADHLDLPEGTVKSRIRSGLQNARLVFDSELLADAEG